MIQKKWQEANKEEEGETAKYKIPSDAMLPLRATGNLWLCSRPSHSSAQRPGRGQ